MAKIDKTDHAKCMKYRYFSRMFFVIKRAYVRAIKNI